MTPKKEIYATSKEKELASATTPSVQRLESISKSKIKETSWPRIWEEIKSGHI